MTQPQGGQPCGQAKRGAPFGGRGGGSGHGWGSTSHQQSPAKQCRATWGAQAEHWGQGGWVGWGVGAVPAEFKSRTNQPPNISWLSCQLGNADTQHFSQIIGGIKGRRDCAANEIYSEPQIPSSTAFFLSLEYKQPDLSFILSRSLHQDSCLLSWLDASNKAENFTLAIPV